MNEQRVMLRGIKPSTFALYVGAFGAILGVAVSLMYLISGTVQYSQATDSLIRGLLFGLSVGVLSVLVIPAVYFAIGWVIGYVEGLIINAVMRTSGGIELSVSPAERDVETEEMAAPASTPEYTANKGEPAFGERIERRPRVK